MTTKITISGDTKSADAAIDDVVDSLSKGEKAAKGFAGGLDKAGASLGRAEQRAKAAASQLRSRAAAAMQSTGAAANKMAGSVGGAASAIAGLGSALGVQGAGLAGAAAGLGSFGVALGAVAVAGASAVSVYRDLTKTTNDVGESHNFAVQAIRDGIVAIRGETEAVKDLNALQQRDADFQKTQAARVEKQSRDRKAAAAQKLAEHNRELSTLERLVETENEKARLERFAGRAAAQFGSDRQRADEKLLELATAKAQLLSDAANMEGTAEERARQSREIQRDLRTIEAERVGVKQALISLTQDEAKAAAARAKEEAEQQREADRLAAGIHRRRVDEANKRLALMKKEADERQAQLARLLKGETGAAPARRPVGGGRGRGAVGGLLGGAFGAIGGSLGAAGGALGAAGIDTSRGGASDSGEGVLEAARALTEAEIDKAARRAGVDGDIVDAMKAQLAAQQELDAQQEQMARDQKQFKALADAIFNRARGRRQRSGR